MRKRGFDVIGKVDDVAEGDFGLVCELAICWAHWRLACTPALGPYTVGPLHVSVDSVCVG